jgi:Tfp pilus assembly protein PilE
MIAVAIIAVLAAVVIPSFTKETKRGKSKSEISSMLAELVTREENHKTESGVYLAAPACPSSSSSSGTDMTTATCSTSSGQPWVDMRVQATQQKLTCSYTISIGDHGTDPSGHTDYPTWATWTTPANPAVNWYFIVADCPDTQYFQGSWEGKIRSKDGH